MIQVHWSNKRGAGCMRTFANGEAAIPFLKDLKAEAIVYDSEHEKCGEVTRNEGEHYNRRVKWLWWIERTAS